MASPFSVHKSLTPLKLFPPRSTAKPLATSPARRRQRNNRVSQNVFINWFQKANSPQNCQLIVDYLKFKQKVDSFLGKLTF